MGINIKKQTTTMTTDRRRQTWPPSQVRLTRFSMIIFFQMDIYLKFREKHIKKSKNHPKYLKKTKLIHYFFSETSKGNHDRPK